MLFAAKTHDTICAKLGAFGFAAHFSKQGALAPARAGAKKKIPPPW